MPDPRVFLKDHPAHRSDGIEHLSASIARHADRLSLTYELKADLAGLIIPNGELGVRRDELWKTTCFELFMSSGDTRYIEYDFSPGGDWAAYQFSDYRENGQNLESPPPLIETSQSGDLLSVSVSVPMLPANLAVRTAHIGLTAVIESVQGKRSYWALDHLGEAPDFHRAETFTLTLE